MPVITATRDSDTITGTTGADSIVGSNGNDLIFAGQGNDTVTGAGTGFGLDLDTLRGGAGNDLIIDSGARTFGDNGDDTISGGPSESTAILEGGPGDDLIDGRLSFDSGNAWVAYVTALSGVKVDLSIHAPQAVGGGAGADILSNLNGALGSPYNDTLTGDGQNPQVLSYLFGGAGDDVLSTPRGGWMTGGPGDDTLIGGTGAFDWAIYGSTRELIWLGAPDFPATSGVNVSLAIAGPQAVGGGMGVDTLIGIENVQGSAFADTLTAGSAGARLEAGGGDDSLVGGGGADNLYGDVGADTLLGGAGGDTLGGADGNDLMLGEDGDDQLGGGNNADDLRGGAGNDQIFGGAGRDTIQGGSGNDQLAGDAGFDNIEGNQGNDTCSGGDDDDTVRGGQGDDSVSGGNGNDFVSGDRGSDTLSGGTGADLFHGSQDAGLDRVTDFKLADGDRVMLDPGTTYTTSQVGADTVIDMGGGNQMVLVGVQLSTLTSGWVFVG